MEFRLHVTRARYWSRNTERRIGFEEWIDLVESDPELSFDEGTGPARATWDGFSSFDTVWFEWRHGNISTVFWDEFVIEKALDMARVLGAGVQGPDGERYPGPDDDPYRKRPRTVTHRSRLVHRLRRLFGR